MLDLLYDLTPGEDLSLIDGHLLILLLGSDDVSDELEGRVIASVTRLDDASEFFMAVAKANDFPELQDDHDTPTLIHLLSGVVKFRAVGVDECVDYYEEFIINNRCRPSRRRRMAHI